jgi:drug/metabolite transporter (DMT)-like permease
VRVPLARARPAFPSVPAQAARPTLASVSSTSDPGQALGALAALVTSVTWAFASARYADAARSAGGVRVNLVRALVATALWGAAFMALEGPRALAGVSATQALLLAASIACSYGIGDNVFYVAARRIGISAALAIATIYPLWAALYGVLFRAEPLGLGRALGLACCLGGVAALSAQSGKGGSDGTRASGRAALAGVALALLTSLFWAGNAVCLKLGGEGLSLYLVNALRFAIGALLLAVQLPFQRTRADAPGSSLPKLTAALWLPLLADAGIGSVCYTYGIVHSDLALGATLSSLSPLVSLPLAALYGTERVGPAKVLAVSMTVAGVVLLVLAT